MGRTIVHAAFLVLAACEMQTTNQTSSGGPNCGQGTVEVNGTCQLAPSLSILNGDTRASAKTHWTWKNTNIAFYGDHTGVFWQPGAEVCPGSCHAPAPTACGDACVDTSTNGANCGACGNACATGQQCTAGKCVPLPDGGAPSSEPGTGSESTGISGTFQWSELANGGILNQRADGRPFANLTNIQGGVGDGNFTATANGSIAESYTLGSGPPCQ